MLTLPEIVTRLETPYFAVRRNVALPFRDEVPAILETLFARLEREELAAEEPVFFKHTVVDMPRIGRRYTTRSKRAGPGVFRPDDCFHKADGWLTGLPRRMRSAADAKSGRAA